MPQFMFLASLFHFKRTPLIVPSSYRCRSRKTFVARGCVRLKTRSNSFLYSLLLIDEFCQNSLFLQVAAVGEREEEEMAMETTTTMEVEDQAGKAGMTEVMEETMSTEVMAVAVVEGAMKDIADLLKEYAHQTDRVLR